MDRAERSRQWRLANPNYHKEWYARNPDYNKQWCARNPNYAAETHARLYTGSFENKLKAMITLARKRARKKKLDCSITDKDFTPITHCPLLGIAFDFAKKGKGTADNSPTLDRINPSKGYVPGNVWVISAKANRMKSDATLRQLEQLVVNLRKKIWEF